MFESKYGCSIREGQPEDLDEIMRVYGCAKAYMDANGNPNQWVGYPTREMIADDIEKGQCYVCISADGQICGVFAFIMGVDETYLYIEGGQWLNDKPYGTIHRIGSDGSVKGVFASCMEFCKTLSEEIRIDTHEDNKTMQHLIEKSGFQRCGIIYVRGGSPRIAYQLVTESDAGI